MSNAEVHTGNIEQFSPPYNFDVLSFSSKLHFRRSEVCSQFQRFAISIGARSAPEKKCSAISTCLQFLHFQNLWSAAISMLLQFLHSAIYRVYAISTDYNFHTRAERASEKLPIQCACTRRKRLLGRRRREKSRLRVPLARGNAQNQCAARWVFSQFQHAREARQRKI